nr:hypothetical protein CFP56_07850 [Quercus suber]
MIIGRLGIGHDGSLALQNLEILACPPTTLAPWTGTADPRCSSRNNIDLPILLREVVLQILNTRRSSFQAGPTTMADNKDDMRTEKMEANEAMEKFNIEKVQTLTSISAQASMQGLITSLGHRTVHQEDIRFTLDFEALSVHTTLSYRNMAFIFTCGTHSRSNRLRRRPRPLPPKRQHTRLTIAPSFQLTPRGVRKSYCTVPELRQLFRQGDEAVARLCSMQFGPVMLVMLTHATHATTGNGSLSVSSLSSHFRASPTMTSHVISAISTRTSNIDLMLRHKCMEALELQFRCRIKDPRPRPLRKARHSNINKVHKQSIAEVFA